MKNVYLFVPNLIGYVRILLLFIGFYDCMNAPNTFFLCYALSQLLDMADGHAARSLDQCSRFGAVLDMVTDRCSTAALLAVLSNFYSRFVPFFALVIALDIASHFSHLYSTLIRGVSSHKIIDENNFAILQIYYHNKYFLGFMCFGNESFWLLAYALHFLGFSYEIPLLSYNSAFLMLSIISPVALGKQIINVIQLIQAAKDIVKIDISERSPK